MRKEVLRMSNICRSEGEIEIIKDGSLHLFESEIVGLIGRNHAGKSTLMGAATGEFPCHTGDIWINEKRRPIASIEQARKEGIFLIKDESSLVDEFTIKDSMKLNFAFLDRRMRFSVYFKKCREVLADLEVLDSYDTKIRELNFHKRVLVEIAQAIVCGVKILILDNVASMLSVNAREQFRQVFRMLQLRGISILLIENQPDCIQPFLERLYVMRKGKVVAELAKHEIDGPLALSLTEGVPFRSDIIGTQSGYHEDNGRAVLEFCDVYTADGVIAGLSFALHENECLGIWNRNRHSGKGIFDILQGRSKIAAGTVRTGPGLMLIPEEDQLCSNMDLGENIRLAALRRNAYGGVVPKEGELRYLVQDLCSEYFTEDGYRLFPNQVIPDNILLRKKASLCRAVAAGASVIAYNNPSLKLDVREKKLFARDIVRTGSRQISQVIIGAYRDDLEPVCNRILQVEEGRVVQIITAKEQ